MIHRLLTHGVLATAQQCRIDQSISTLVYYAVSLDMTKYSFGNSEVNRLQIESSSEHVYTCLLDRSVTRRLLYQFTLTDIALGRNYLLYQFTLTDLALGRM